MTLTQLVTHLREAILHDTGGTGYDWTANDITCRHSNNNLVDFINIAQDEVAKRTMCFLNSASEVVQAGFYIDLPSDFLEIKSVLLTKPATEESHLLESVSSEVYEVSVLKNDKCYAYTAEKNTTRLYFTGITSGDEADYTVVLSYYALPTAFTWATDQAVDSTLPREWQIQSLDYAAYRAFLKDDPDVLDVNRAEEFEARFTRTFGTHDNKYSIVRRNRDHTFAPHNGSYLQNIGY